MENFKGGRSGSGSGSMFNGVGAVGHFGTVTTCKSDDQSTYCKINRAFNMLIILFVTCFIFYMIYYVFFKKRK